MDIILIAGLWLDGSAWDKVVPELERRGHRPLPITLPGQGDGATSAMPATPATSATSAMPATPATPPMPATLDDQVAAVVAAVDAADGPALVVGHSAACSLAWIAADQRPDKVARVALIGGFPEEAGNAYADFFEPEDGAMAFPGWEPFAGADSDDMSEELKAEVAARMLPVPVGVTRGTVRLTDERRRDVPITLVCPEFSPTQAREWIDHGDTPELGAAHQLELVDIDSGHWPMFTQPAALAALLAECADRSGSTAPS